jgi:hypothetical protein
MTDKKEAQNSWVTNASGRKQFWAAATAAGLDEDNVHEIFGVESMYDYPGTLAEAIATLKEWEANQPPPEPGTAPEPDAPEAPQDDGLADKLAYRCQQLPEAPAVAWTKFETPGGFIWSLTLRAGLQPELARLALTQVREEIELFEKGAAAHKWLPVADGRDVTALRAHTGSPQAQPSAPPPTRGNTPPPAASNGGNGSLSFDAETLAANVSGGNTYWKVKGGKFARWGVTIWPEVLTDAGFDPDSLDPMQDYDLNGYIAHYVVNENNKPQKVITLERKSV